MRLEGLLQQRGGHPSQRRLIAASATTAAQEQPGPSPAAASDADDWRALLLGEALGSDAAAARLGRLVLRGRVGAGMPYRQATLRPVAVKGRRALQLSLLDARRDTTKNFSSRSEAAARLQELLALPWSSASLQTAGGGGGGDGGGSGGDAAAAGATLSVQVTKRGRALIQRSSGGGGGSGASSDNSSSTSNSGGGATAAAAPRHDRRKALLLPGDAPDAFLMRIGLQTSEGKVKAAARDKFVQVNKFLELLVHTGEIDALLRERGSGGSEGGSGVGSGGSASGSGSSSGGSSSDSSGGGSSSGEAPQPALRLLDCGCGSAHLTWGVYRYLTASRGARVAVGGVDTNAALMARSAALARELGLADADAAFEAAPIRGYAPAAPPDVVLALHACDTATDEALALGAAQRAAVIMSVPCCHKDLHRQFSAAAGGKSGGKSGGLGSGGSGGFLLPGLEAEAAEAAAAADADADADADAAAALSAAGGLRGVMAPLLRHGILKQRWLDLLTDALRAQLLRLAGYRCVCVCVRACIQCLLLGTPPCSLVHKHASTHQSNPQHQ